ncbi:MAG: hypothetical protein ACRCV9_09600 [Burkholderiaceae bacterium]
MIAQGESWVAQVRMDGSVTTCGRLWAGAVLAAIPLCAAASSTGPLNPTLASTQCESSSATREWWLDLTLPPLARVASSKRQAHLQAIKQQQAQITEILAQRGVAVCGRVTHVRNALAVQATAEQAAQLRSLSGVRAISLVSQHNRLHGAAAPEPPEEKRN